MKSSASLPANFSRGESDRKRLSNNLDAAFERAISIDPSDATAYAQLRNALIRSGRPTEGLEQVHYAMRLSPRDPIMLVWLEFAGNAEKIPEEIDRRSFDMRRSSGARFG